MEKVIIIDYGMGNLRSVFRAFEECGGNVEISDDPKSLDTSTHIVLPGVGAFGEAMKNLYDRGWTMAIQKNAVDEKIPMLGICLGMQLLATKSYEGGEHNGLNLVPGEVVRMESGNQGNGLRVPHIGWNEVNIEHNISPLLEGIHSHLDFYFVHSYIFKPFDKNHILATTPYGQSFTSIVSNKNIYGAQFHPEKSSTLGLRLIRNFLQIK